MTDISPCVFDVYVSPLLDCKSLTELALSTRYATTCVHGCDNYEVDRVFGQCRIRNHPVNVFIRADAMGHIRRALGFEWCVTPDVTVLATRLLRLRKAPALNVGDSESSLRDISAIVALQSMTYLNLYRTNVADISILPACTNLGALGLSFTRVTDFSPLLRCPNLHTLSIMGMDIPDLIYTGLLARGVDIRK